MSDAAPRPEDRRAARNRIQQTLQAVLAQVDAEPERLVEILSATPEALVAFAANRQILHANARAAAVFGYARGELESRSTDELIPPRLRQPDAPPMRATEDLMQVELPGLMRDGTERMIEWCFGATRGNAAGDAIFVMTVRDRLELDRALEALRASEERFQLLVNGVRDCAIFMLDEHSRVSSWNAGATRIKGWKASEILGQPFEVFFTPEDRAAGVPQRLISDAAKDGSREVTGWRVRRDGSTFWAHGSLTVLRNADGELHGFAKITRDLTERRNAEEIERRLIAERAARAAAQEAEQRLRASEEDMRRLQRMTASLSEAVTPEEVSKVVLRECTEALGAAGGAVYLLSPGRRELQLVGQRGYSEAFMAPYASLSLTAHTPLADAARARTPLFYETREAFLTDYPALRGALSTGSFEAAVALPLVARGELVGTMGLRFEHRRTFTAAERVLVSTMGDLCSQALERARLFTAEREARASAEAASRSKDEFLAMLGHELRNPLAPIRTAVQLMKVRGDDRSIREREVIDRQLSHLGKLVDDLLDVSRVARGLIALSRIPVEMSEIVAKAVEMASPLLEQRAQNLVVSVPRTGLRLNADSLRMAQVVANLLANAAKYTPPRGQVWLSATQEGDQVVVRVRDNGDGIAPDLLPRIFDLFVQGAQTVARSEGGLGLGLALVKSFVTLHGGTVSVSSEGPGRGSEFVVRVPGLASPETAVPAAGEPPPQAAKPGKRILVVDDNQDACDMLSELLRALGHDVKVAYDGPSALLQLETFPAEIAILDLGLPVMDGFELARQVTKQQAGARPRLIAVTGYGRDRDITQSRSVGFDVHLVKPVDLTALVTALDAGPALVA